MATAIEMYAIDHKVFPANLTSLTTPVTYITQLFMDPFVPKKQKEEDRRFSCYFHGIPEIEGSGYLIWGMGPDEDRDITEKIIIGLLEMQDGLYNEGFVKEILLFQYDPTNGTRSSGDMMQFSTGWY